MEFFERAHISKSKITPRKGNKSDETVKKQLKEMLYGYRHSDSALIKGSADVKNEFEDSSSVSGYSDLNLTNSSEGDKSHKTISSGCGDETHETLSSDYSEAHLPNKLDLTMDQSLNSESIEGQISPSLSIESISQYDEDLNSHSEDASPRKLDEMVKSDTENESEDSFIVTSTDFDSHSEEESDFDADGALAAQIMKNINETKKEKKKSKKRKFEQLEETEIQNVCLASHDYKGPYRPQKDDVDMENLSLEMSNVSLPEKKFAGPYRPKSQSDESQREIMSDDSMPQSLDFSANFQEPLSPFVSVVATDMESQSLTDVLGQYKHPTIRNLPSDNNNAFSTNNSGLFETENVNVVDVESEDDVCSLIPEVDDVPGDEIELEMTVSDTSIEPQDESTAYDHALQSEETSERELSIDSIDPSVVTPVTVYYGKNNQCIFVMKHPVEIYIHGKVKVKCLGGSVEVFGYTLQDEPQEIYAPNYNYAQCIKTQENQNVYYGLFGKLTSSGISVQEAEDIVTTIGEYDGIISMQPLKSRQMDFVENNFTVTDLFSKPSKNIENCFKKASELLGCSLYLSKPWKSFEDNPIWIQALDYGLTDQSRGIVCGGKGLGKSTFLRYYVNKRLAIGPMLVVDLDPGQCEFTVAGNISATVVTEPLLGPNFTHLKTPQMMLNIGMINTMDNPRRYAAAVQALLTHCANDDNLKNLPWIINTMGMTNTVGLKFMSLIILQAQPTFLLQIDSRNNKKRYDFHLYAQTVKNLYFEDYQTDPLFCNVKEVNLNYAFFLMQNMDSGVKNNFSLAPRDERYLNFLSYFGELLNVRSGSLLSVVPYQVNLRDLKIGLNVKIHDDAVTKVINGKIVALCQSLPNTNSVFSLADEPLKCFGAGLVRGIDWDKEVVYVLTPVAAARLASADCAVYADWAPELRGPDTARGVPAGAPLPYRTAAGYQQRQFMFSPKRRFNPLQLLKMSRSS